MPELPEVETVRRVLKSQLLSLEIQDVEIRYPALIQTDNFKELVKHKAIEDIQRYGKYLIFILNDGAILSHLRMEGKFFYVKEGSMDNKHIHVIFHLSNGYMLCYQDVRKFGRLAYKTFDEIYTTAPLNKVGIDPILSKEIAIQMIYDKIVRRSIPIKSVLLDQSIICGLGNIYVDEVLYKAQISPLRPSNEVSPVEVEQIVFYSKQIMSKAIELKGTTIRSYTSSLGVIGQYQNYLCVHKKTECPSCSSKLDVIKIGGRTTYYCKKCQR